MKFGGTSVEDAVAIDRTARIVAGRRAQGASPIVVVSAMAKVTDQLIAAANAAGRGDRAGALAISARLRHRHHDTARKLLTQAPNFSDTPTFCEMSEWIDKKFESLDEIFRGLAAVGELTARTSDLVVSFGEQLSSRMVTAGFAARGLGAVHVDARKCIVTDAQHGRAIPNDALIEKRLAEFVLPLLRDEKASGDGRLHRLDRRGRDHDAGPRRIGFYRGAGGWRAECVGD